ncbi:MAG TPA: hypothetical protein VF656_03510 [Pyrinomonadaceae bacterium]
MISEPSTPTRTTKSTVVLSDYFSKKAVSAQKWKPGSLTAGSSFTDEGIEIAEEDGKLQVKPRAGVATRSYNGYVSASAWDMTAAHARVEVLQTTAGTANTIFAVGIDSNNWYGFVIEGGKLYMQSKIGGKKNSTDIPYNATQHRFWRLRHEAMDNEILWETSTDGENWTVQRRLTPQLSLTNLYIYLGAGTYLNESNPGTAVFDNFRLVAHVEQ